MDIHGCKGHIGSYIHPCSCHDLFLFHDRPKWTANFQSGYPTYIPRYILRYISNPLDEWMDVGSDCMNGFSIYLGLTHAYLHTYLHTCTHIRDSAYSLFTFRIASILFLRSSERHPTQSIIYPPRLLPIRLPTKLPTRLSARYRMRTTHFAPCVAVS